MIGRDSFVPGKMPLPGSITRCQALSPLTSGMWYVHGAYVCGFVGNRAAFLFGRFAVHRRRKILTIVGPILSP